jgi:hypothetical protein
MNTISFAATTRAECCFIRLTETAINHLGTTVLRLFSVEFFGTLADYSGDASPQDFRLPSGPFPPPTFARYTTTPGDGSQGWCSLFLVNESCTQL